MGAIIYAQSSLSNKLRPTGIYLLAVTELSGSCTLASDIGAIVLRICITVSPELLDLNFSLYLLLFFPLFSADHLP